MKAKIRVELKKGVHDPQGEAVGSALRHLGFSGVARVRVGKYIELELDGDSREKAQAEVEAMCRKLLSNPVIESYSFELES